MADVLQQVSAQLQVRLNEIDAEERQLRNALLSLAESPVSTNGTKTKRRKGNDPGVRKVVRPRKARAAKGQRRAEVSAILQANPKAKTSEIARQIGISPNQVSGLRKQLTTSGELKAAARKPVPKRTKPKAAKAKKAGAKKPKATKKASAKKAASKAAPKASPKKAAPKRKTASKGKAKARPAAKSKAGKPKAPKGSSAKGAQK